MFEARKLSCVRGKRLLFSDLSFTVKAGEALHIKGENGSGKSSLIKLLVGLAEPESGEVIWQGRSLNEDSYDFYRQLLFIGHKVGMNTHLSAEQNLDWYCQRQGIAFPDETKAEVFRTWSLYGFEDLPARQLSAGQQRKIALCRLMLEKKPLWILDEPLVSLDQAGMDIFSSLLGAHLQAGGMAVLTSHQDLSQINQTVRVLSLSEADTSSNSFVEEGA